jgi:hypothetical protein
MFDAQRRRPAQCSAAWQPCTGADRDTPWQDADQDTKEVSSRLKSLVTDVIGQYRGFGGTTGIGAPAAESAVEDADIASTVDGMDMGDCGPDGCEIVW